MDIWKSVAIWLCFALSCNASKFSLSEYPGIRVCRVREKDCAISPYQPFYLTYLNNLYRGCTHILGNLVLCDLERHENGSDPDLSFLSDIVEVSGYVYLSRNSVKTIPLPSLRVIRGDPPYIFNNITGSMIVTRNGKNKTHALEFIDLPNLTAIKQHNVIVRDNPLLCHFAFTIRWDEIFLDSTSQGFIPDRQHDRVSHVGCDPAFRLPEQKRIQKTCDGRCVMKHDRGFCWGPGPNSCQKLVKCKDKPDKYCQDGPATDILCNQECLGGCDNHPNNCRACLAARDGNRCVSQCPPKEIVSRVDSRLEPNPNFKYTFHDICVKDCPAPFLKSNIYCIIECNLESQIPVNGTCQTCPAEGCPEHCKEDQIFDIKPYIIDDLALDRLKKCVYYTGRIYISQESFKPSGSWKPITEIEKLWNLRSIKGIVGYIYMDLRGAPPELKNLTFLDNLDTLVWESGKTYIPVITILNGEHIEMLGFRSLRDINSPVHLVNMTKLCYTSALTNSIPVQMKNVPTEQECAQRDAVCHSECLPEAGCWGPTADMCAHCCNRKAGQFCVSECTDRDGFYEVRRSSSGMTGAILKHGSGPVCPTLPLTQSEISNINKDELLAARRPALECSRCDEECAETCYGPGPHECQGRCKHFQHNDKCVAVCPRDTYIEAETNRCLPCHTSCLHSIVSTETRLCSGPGDHFGVDGCTACLTLLQNSTTRQFQCLTADCPLKHYIESYLSAEFIRKEQIIVAHETEELINSKPTAGFMVRVCKPCHPFCDVCTANGTHSSICHDCRHWWFKSECVLQCPPGETYTPQTTTATPTTTADNQENDNVITENQLNQPGQSDASNVVNQRLVRDDMAIRGKQQNQTMQLGLFAPSQQHCSLCHEECVQGCSGPGPQDCAKCRNYMVVLDEDKNDFVCNSSCPEDRIHVLHGMCLSAEQYAKLSGRSARETRDRILIAVAVSVLLLIILATIILVLCLKRKAESERMREKLRSAYTNLLEPDKDELMKNQSTIREPNMGRLEMINADDLDFDNNNESPLGTGAFGVVYRGRWRVPKAALIKHGCHGEASLDVAIKVIQNQFQCSPSILKQADPFTNGMNESDNGRDEQEEARRATARSNIEELLQEAKIMASVEHRHCLPLIGVCLTRERHCLVSVFVELGSLDKYVKEYRAELNSLTMLSWAEQIADGMSYLEMRGIIHRDLAARNVLVQRRDLVQITDFGLAKMLERKDENSVVVHAGRVPIRWLAIETLQNSIYSHKTDVWSYGVTLWEIFTYGRRPYEDVETKNIKDHVMKGGRLTQPDICTLDVYMVMVKCWMEDYESRPTFVELTRTFHNFCKTPGRYLYIQGDEYAINYHASTYGASTNVSSDTHELQPLLSRGTPYSSPSVYAPKSNGSLCRTTITELSAGTMPVQHRFPRSPNHADYHHTSLGANSDQSMEPEPDSNAMLPTRTNHPSHGIWPIRGRNAGAGPSTPTTSMGTSGIANASAPTDRNKKGRLDGMLPVATTTVPGSGSTSPKTRFKRPAPLAAREDSWMNEGPESPTWNPPGSLDARSISQRSPSKGIAPNPEPTFERDRVLANPIVSTPGTSSHLSTQWNRSDNSSGYLLPPQNPSSIQESGDGYLEPKSNFFVPASQTTPKSGHGQMVTVSPKENPISKDEYLTPKSNQSSSDVPPVTDFGISNMEYFMQPYLSASGSEYPESQNTNVLHQDFEEAK